MKIVELHNGWGEALFSLTFIDLEKLTQLCHLAALATTDSAIPQDLQWRDDLKVLAEAYVVLFELASMLSGGEEGNGLAEYRKTAAEHDFPFTIASQERARIIKEFYDPTGDTAPLDEGAA